MTDAFLNTVRTIDATFLCIHNDPFKKKRSRNFSRERSVGRLKHYLESGSGVDFTELFPVRFLRSVFPIRRIESSGDS